MSNEFKYAVSYFEQWGWGETVKKAIQDLVDIIEISEDTHTLNLSLYHVVEFKPLSCDVERSSLMDSITDYFADIGFEDLFEDQTFKNLQTKGSEIEREVNEFIMKSFKSKGLYIPKYVADDEICRFKLKLALGSDSSMIYGNLDEVLSDIKECCGIDL